MSYTPKELTWVGVAKEPSWGTATPPTFFIPFKDAKPEDVIAPVKDEGIRGAMAQTYNIMQGLANSTSDISCDAYPDILGFILDMILGSDTVAGTASPHTHSFKLSRTQQPSSFTLSRYDGTNVREFAGQVAEQVDLKWASGAALQVSLKSQGKLSTVAGGLTPTPPTDLPLLGWEFGVTLAGAPNLNLVGFDLSLKRKLYVQHAANNSEDPTAIVALGLGITGKATFDKADDTELSAFLSNTQPALVLTGVQSGTGFGCTIQMSKCAFIKDPITGKEVVQGDVEFEGVDNTTDGGPGLISVINGVASY